MNMYAKFPTVNISKLFIKNIIKHFLLVIWIAKDLIWTTLKVIFSVFIIFFYNLRFQINQSVVSRPNIFLS